MGSARSPYTASQNGKIADPDLQSRASQLVLIIRLTPLRRRNWTQLGDISKDFGRLPGDMELAIFRVVQECLTNIHRHAESKTARIRLARDKASVCIEVRDEGRGISPERLEEIESRGSGVGIPGIRERLRQFRGELKIESGVSGTTVIASIPIAKEASSSNFAPLQAAV